MENKEYKIDIKNNWIFFNSNDLLFGRKYNMNITQILLYNSMLYVLAYPKINDSRSPDFVPYDKNNVFAFDGNGNLLWRAGKYIQTLGNDRRVELPASSLTIDNEMIKLYYQSDHEVWLDPKTGEKIKEEFVFKK